MLSWQVHMREAITPVTLSSLVKSQIGQTYQLHVFAVIYTHLTEGYKQLLNSFNIPFFFLKLYITRGTHVKFDPKMGGS